MVSWLCRLGCVWFCVKRFGNVFVWACTVRLRALLPVRLRHRYTLPNIVSGLVLILRHKSCIRADSVYSVLAVFVCTVGNRCRAKWRPVSSAEAPSASTPSQKSTSSRLLSRAWDRSVLPLLMRLLSLFSCDGATIVEFVLGC